LFSFFVSRFLSFFFLVFFFMEGRFFILIPKRSGKKDESGFVGRVVWWSRVVMGIGVFV
jgi:hypothetical protein